MTALFTAATLTRRQLEILAFVAEGWESPQIGKWFFVSEDTIKTHLRRAFRAIGARNRAHAVHLLHLSGVAIPDVSTIPEGGSKPETEAPPAVVFGRPRPAPGEQLPRPADLGSQPDDEPAKVVRPSVARQPTHILRVEHPMKPLQTREYPIAATRVEAQAWMQRLAEKVPAPRRVRLLSANRSEVGVVLGCRR